MVLLEGGTFSMGSPASEEDRDDDEPQQKITLASFPISEAEVTQGQFERVLGRNPVMDNDRGKHGLGPDFPVVCVSWLEAVAYCNALSLAEGLPPAYAREGDEVR